MRKLSLALIAVLASLAPARAQVPFQILGQASWSDGEHHIWILTNGPGPQKIWACSGKWVNTNPAPPTCSTAFPQTLPQGDPSESYILAAPPWVSNVGASGASTSAFAVSNRGRVIHCVLASGFRVLCSNTTQLPP
jgi:hypothetical protein